MTVDKMLSNDVPMQSNGFYSSNSALQHAAMLHALPLISAAVTRRANESDIKQNKRFTAIEYGSADGKNSYVDIFQYAPKYIQDANMGYLQW